MEFEKTPIMSLEKLSMARPKGGMNIAERGLKWSRFNRGSPVSSFVSGPIYNELFKYKKTFAPFIFGQSTPTATKFFNSIKLGDGGCFYVWYADDSFFNEEVENRIKSDNTFTNGMTPEEGEKKKDEIINLGKFLKSHGVPVHSPGKSQNPADKNYGNLSDYYLSHFGYAFNGQDGVNVIRGSSPSPEKSSEFSSTLALKVLNEENKKREKSGLPVIKVEDLGKDAMWAYADAFKKIRKNDPEKGEVEIAQIEILPDSKGNFALYRVFKDIDPITKQLSETKKEPLLHPEDYQNPSAYRIYYRKHIKSYQVPGIMRVWMPNGPEGEVKFVRGNTRNPRETEHESRLFRDESDPAGHTRSSSQFKDSLKSQLWDVIFDGPEGGILIKNCVDPKNIHPLNKNQIEQIVDWGLKTDNKMLSNKNFINPSDEGYFNRLWLVSREKKVGGKEESYGPWDISPEDKEKIRQKYKKKMDLLGKLLDTYHEVDHFNKDRTKQYRGRPVNSESVRIAIITPSCNDPEMKRTVYDSLRSSGNNATASVEYITRKIAELYDNVPFQIDGAWEVLMHDVNAPRIIASEKSSLGNAQNIDRKDNRKLRSLREAVATLSSHFSMPPDLLPDESEIAYFDKLWDSSIQEIKENRIIPNVNNETSRQMDAESKNISKKDKGVKPPTSPSSPIDFVETPRKAVQPPVVPNKKPVYVMDKATGKWKIKENLVKQNVPPIVPKKKPVYVMDKATGQWKVKENQPNLSTVAFSNKSVKSAGDIILKKFSK